MSDNLPEWLPDEYDPDEDLESRIRAISEIDSAVELKVRDKHGVIKNVRIPHHFHESDKLLVLDCGPNSSDIEWEVAVPLTDADNPHVKKVDQDQSHEDYMRRKVRRFEEVDVRLHAIDDDRLQAEGEPA